MALTGNQRRYLRGLAHHRDAIVQVGHQGVTEGVVRQLAQALNDHELVKVRLAQAVDDRAGAVQALGAGAKADLVQLLGRTVVLYRRHPKKPVIELPRPHGVPGDMPLPTRRASVDDDADEVDSAEEAGGDDEVD